MIFINVDFYKCFNISVFYKIEDEKAPLNTKIQG